MGRCTKDAQRGYSMPLYVIEGSACLSVFYLCRAFAGLAHSGRKCSALLLFMLAPSLSFVSDSSRGLVGLCSLSASVGHEVIVSWRVGVLCFYSTCSSFLLLAGMRFPAVHLRGQMSRLAHYGNEAGTKHGGSNHISNGIQRQASDEDEFDCRCLGKTFVFAVGTLYDGIARAMLEVAIVRCFSSN